MNDRSASAEIRLVVELLALSGKEATARVGAPGKTADRMAFRFDEAYTLWVANLGELPHPGVLESLQRIDTALLDLAKPEHRELWTDAELCANPAWEALRTLARDAVSQLEA